MEAGCGSLLLSSPPHCLFLLLQNVTQVYFYNNIPANSPSRFHSDTLCWRKKTSTDWKGTVFNIYNKTEFSPLLSGVDLLASELTFSEGSFRALRSSSSSSRIFRGLLGVFFPFESPLPSEFFRKHTQCHWAAKLKCLFIFHEKSDETCFKFMERNLPQNSYKQGCNRSSSDSVNR